MTTILLLCAAFFAGVVYGTGKRHEREFDAFAKRLRAQTSPVLQ